MMEDRRYETDEERSRRRKQRILEMKRQKRRAELLQKRVIPAAVLVIFCFAVMGMCSLARSSRKNPENNAHAEVAESSAVENSDELVGNVSNTSISGQQMQMSIIALEPGDFYGPMLPEEPVPPAFTAVNTTATVGFGDSVISEYGVMIDVESGTILAGKGEKTRISPASMTKILTVLTAADNLGLMGEDWENAPVLDEKFTITIEITDYCYIHDCSNVGFEIGEEVTVRDLFYGTILPSGADAAMGLAQYVAGSQEAFAELMNQELEKLGLSETTHFTNCIGLYDENHYSTAYDIAVILKTAADSPFCRDVLSAHTYNTSGTTQHPEGLLISNWFLRRIEDKDTHGEVICAKTGYVVQSGSCAASLGTDGDGREYICVTAGSASSWRCIYDHVELYQTWLKAEQ